MTTLLISNTSHHLPEAQKLHIFISDEDPHLDPDPLFGLVDPDPLKKKLRIQDLDPPCILSELTSVDPDPLFYPVDPDPLKKKCGYMDPDPLENEADPHH